MVAAWPAIRLANEQLIDWLGRGQTPLASALTPVTTRRGSTESVATTLWVVLEAPVLVTLMVKVWPVVPATTDVSAKALTTLRLASEVIATSAVAEVVAVTSVETALALLGTAGSAAVSAATL